jgi:hypothetical protein
MFLFEFLKIHKIIIEKYLPPLRYIDRVHVPEGTALPNRECPSAVL